MRYTLKEYQEEAAEKLLEQIERGCTITSAQKGHATILNSPTGSGKTVIITKVIEDIISKKIPDIQNPVFLWVSSDPELNYQSESKLTKASSLLEGLTKVIDTECELPKLEKNTIYMINTQKLGKSSKLVRGHYKEDNSYDFYDTIKNTIEDPTLDVILIVDEAHQGTKTSKSGMDSTIVQKLLGGIEENNHSYPTMPLVVGMTATPGTLHKTISKTHYHDEVTVDILDVKESGLLKDSLIIEYLQEKGNFESTMIQRASEHYNNYHQAWKKYCTEQSIPMVTPLMIVQVENNIKESRLVDLAHQLSEKIPSLSEHSYGHVIPSGGISTVVEGKGHKIHKVDAARVQDDNEIQILFAKEAITTGWDCPRAEVMISFRPHKDHDYIEQMIGRTMRTPLAGRIEGNDVLNSTTSILPKYDIDNVLKIAEKFEYGGTDNSLDSETSQKTRTREVILQPVELHVHVDNNEDTLLENLPSYSIPKKSRESETDRLRRLSFSLEQDGIMNNGYEETMDLLVNKLVVLKTEFATQVENKIADLEIIELGVITSDMFSSVTSESETVERPYDSSAMDGYVKSAKKVLGEELFLKYSEKIIEENFDEEELDDVIEQAQLETCALAFVDDIIENLNDYAGDTANMWLSQKYKRDIKDLGNAEREAHYHDIAARSKVPVLSAVVLADNIVVDSVKKNDSLQPAPVIPHKKHMYSDDNGNYYYHLGNIEEEVILSEISRKNFCSFYRNPSSGNSSITVPYVDSSGTHRGMHPDFIVFKNVAGKTVASIIDPHGIHLSDSLDKLHGLARFAEKHNADYHEIRAISEIERGGPLHVLNMQDKDVRDKVLQCTTALEAYTIDEVEIVERSANN